VTSPEPSYLFFNQAYDSHWTLTSNGRRQSPLPGQALVNIYRIPKGLSTGRLQFDGQAAANRGLWISAVTLILVTLYLIMSWLFSRRRRRAAQPTNGRGVAVFQS
jgi:hypothetical protein